MFVPFCFGGVWEACQSTKLVTVLAQFLPLTMAVFVVKILASVFIIVLIMSSAVTEKLSEKSENGR